MDGSDGLVVVVLRMILPGLLLSAMISSSATILVPLLTVVVGPAMKLPIPFQVFPEG